MPKAHDYTGTTTRGIIGTPAYGYVPHCSCGWAGRRHPPGPYSRGVDNWAQARDAAQREWRDDHWRRKMTATDSPAGELTAVRIYKGKRAIVTVYLDGDELDQLGGNRAARAAAALVTAWPRDDRPGVWGLRADELAAQQEAHRLETRTSMTTRGRHGRPGSTIPLNRPTWARSVHITDQGEQPKMTDAPVSRLERGYCPTCGTNVALRKGGLTREHTHNGRKCPGSGEAANTTPPTPIAQAAAQAEGTTATVELDADLQDTVAESVAKITEGLEGDQPHPPAEAGDPTPFGVDPATIPERRKARPANVPDASGPVLLRLPLEEFVPAPDNLRRTLGTDDELAELGASIAAKGLIEPVVGQRMPDGKVLVIAGHRRLEGARRNGTVSELDVVIRPDEGDAARIEAMLVENALRRDLDPVEEAHAYQVLVSSYGYTQGKLSERTGRSQPYVSKRLSLLKLPTKVLDAVGTRLNVRDAETLAKLPAKLAEAAYTEAANYAVNADADALGRQLPGAIRRVKEQAETDKKLRAATKDLEGAGVRVVDYVKSWNLEREGMASLHDLGILATPAELEALEDETAEDELLTGRHAPCPGHAAMIDPRTGLVSYVCTNPGDLHPDRPQNDEHPLSHIEEEAAAHEALLELVAQSKADRAAAIRTYLTKRPSAAANAHVMACYVDSFADWDRFDQSFDWAERAVKEFLGEPWPGDDDERLEDPDNWGDVVTPVVATRGLPTVAVALALAEGDRELADWTGAYRRTQVISAQTRRHLQFLVDEVGYAMADWEAELVATFDAEPGDGDQVEELADPAPPADDDAAWEADNPPAITPDVDAIAVAAAREEVE